MAEESHGVMEQEWHKEKKKGRREGGGRERERGGMNGII